MVRLSRVFVIGAHRLGIGHYVSQGLLHPTPAGTFRAAGCDLLQTGTVRAFGDRIPVPDGVEGPRPRRMSPPARTQHISTAALVPSDGDLDAVAHLTRDTLVPWGL